LHRVTPNTLVDTGNGSFVLDGARSPTTPGFGVLTVGGVIQKSSNIGATKIAMAVATRRDVEHVYEHRARAGAEGGFPGRGVGSAASVEKLAPD